MVLKCVCLYVTGQSICTTGGNLMIGWENGLERNKILYVSYDDLERREIIHVSHNGLER